MCNKIRMKEVSESCLSETLKGTNRSENLVRNQVEKVISQRRGTK